jgi:ABC-type taurine transport system ATPase subunit
MSASIGSSVVRLKPAEEPGVPAGHLAAEGQALEIEEPAGALQIGERRRVAGFLDVIWKRSASMNCG